MDGPSPRLAPAEYHQLVSRVREAVLRHVPPGTTLLMVSKGDDELLKVIGRAAWHFPRNEQGQYAGYYPADSTHAIQHLEELRGRGAEYLVFPRTASWWLEHYSDFRRHLEREYPLVVREDTACRIFALRASNAERRSRHADSPGPQCQQLIRQIKSLLESLLPPDVPVIVVTSGEPDLLELGARPVWHFPQTETGAYAGYALVDSAAALLHLEELHAKRGRFLIVPNVISSWLERYPDFPDMVARRYRRVACQAHLGSVFDLDQPALGGTFGNDGSAARACRTPIVNQVGS